MLKPLRWVASSKKDLLQFPDGVRREIGYGLYFAQAGDKHPAAKPLKGFHGAGILEVVEDYKGNTYRAVYTVRFADIVYVLHAFQKKSKKGIATPQPEIELIRDRLKLAQADHQREKIVMKPVTESGGNVFEDLKLANSKELLAKAELARQVYLIIKKRGLTQSAAADLLGLKQPDVSLLMRGRLSRFSTDRLIQLLNVLDRDVEIVVKRKSSSKRKASLKVIAA